ncbi:lysophospholipid acyltransferase family protein [bacterium]|nr:lysophospholipid acyltransferase family protein [bacterium]
MHYTVFDTPILMPLLRVIARFILSVLGWKVVNRDEGLKRYVLIAAPHTSNWDFPMFLVVAFAYEMRAYWLGKHTLFKRPFQGLFRWLGGISVDRTRKTNVVQQCVDHFNSSSEMVIVNAPEGTRSKVNKWKTGFYYIATGAKVPIAFGFLDYKKKEGGIAQLFYPTGNIDSDMKTIQNFYANISGRKPH